MNWNHVRFFLAVAREGSVSRAADKLGVNYTTVARRIVAFETALNTRLFDRLPKGHVMTAAARSIFDRAVAMEQESIVLDRTIFGQDKRLSGRLRLATVDIVAIYFIFPYIAQFLYQYPDINLEIALSDTQVDLSLREADIALRAIFGKPQDDAIGTHIGDFSFGIYGSKTYIAEHPNLNSTETAVLGWLPEPGYSWLPEPFRPDWILDVFPNATQGIKIDAMTVMISALRQGLGICGLPRFVGDNEPGLELVANSNTSQYPSFSLWLLRHVDLRTSSRVSVFGKFLKDIFRRTEGGKLYDRKGKISTNAMT